MRGFLTVLLLAAAGAAEAQQQGSLQISSDTQVLQGSTTRRLGEAAWQPDFGALWTQPGTRFGQFQLELRGSRRENEVHLGRSWFALRDLKARGVNWTFEAGDLYTTAELGDVRFTNLSAPALTFSGGAVNARTTKTTLQIAAGRSTAWRNIFGTDPDALGQTVALLRAAHQATSRVQLTGHASRVRTSDLREFTRTIDASDEGGGGVRIAVTPSVHLVGDGAFVRYRATGSSMAVNDYSYLAGAHVLVARGWLQVNASRFSPGDLPVLNAALQDRSGLFSAGEYDVFNRLRLFGGWETIDTNIHPTGSALNRPAATITREFGGARIRFAPRSTFTIRVDDGGRESKPVLAPVVPGGIVASTSDTGSTTAEVQTTAGRLTAFGRYTRRENVDATFSSATYTQRDSAVQLFLNVSRTTQLFGIATLTDNRFATGTTNTYLQVSAGGQQEIFRQGLWMRVEGSASQNHDTTSGFFVPRRALSLGLNGQIAPYTTIGLNVYLDRAPVGFPGDPQAWLARSTVRVVHTIPTGSVRVANGANGAARAARGSGTVTGSVFADWNANGQPDVGEELLPGIPVELGTISHVTTGRDGEFTFLNVPSGAQLVRLDLNALPVDFDVPAASDITLEISRGESRRVAFALVPLGSVQGRVYQDVNKNGALDPGEPAVENAVAILDAGQRSELVRKGAFRFDAVRAGGHQLALLKESLPEGAEIVGAPERAVAVTRDTPHVDALFLVTIEKRPEVRKVFPPKGGGGPGGQAGRNVAPSRTTASARASSRQTAQALARPAAGDAFTIQIAALASASNAQEVADDLKRGGFDAYVVAPASGEPAGLYRVRVGAFDSRGAAQRTVARLEDRLGMKLWVTKSPKAR